MLRETVPSFLSRIATMNGGDCTGFASDMGLSIKRAIHLDESALRQLANCGDLSPDQLEDLISWTGQQIGDVQTAFRGEVFVTRAIVNPVVRGCPICLREDAQNDTDRPLSNMVMRGHWQLREVSVCLVHSHLLVPLWEKPNRTARYDYSERFPEILPNLMNDDFDQPTVVPSPYDHWLDGRLATGQDETWLAQHSLFAATTFCRLLGKELLRLDPPSSLDAITQRRSAQARGFDVARQGEVAIRDALDALAAFADGAQDGPKKAFGGLYSNLSKDYLDEEAFALFRGLLRDCILDIWPVAAGENLLGVVQTERNLHSIRSAAAETGIGTFLLDQFLVAAGAFDEDETRPVARKTFDAAKYGALLAEIPSLVGPIEMELAMGATRSQFASLAADGVLVPCIDVPTIKSPWRVSDGLELVAELKEMAVPVDPTDKSWESIQRAKSRSSISVGTIIAAIRDRKIQLGLRTDTAEYGGFCVLKVDVDGMAISIGRTIDQPHLTAAAFGRSVGKRKQGWFKMLSAAGHTPSTQMPHPKWGGVRTYVSQADQAAFHERFITPSTMAKEIDRDRREILSMLNAAGIAPFSPSGEDYGRLYLRSEVKGIF
jgi:hypothetical protein